MRAILFESSGWKEFTEWQSTNSKTWKKIVELINESSRTPFHGTGKPEALRYNYKGYWSRRITKEHRLVYKVTDEEITIVACKGHYT